MLPESTCKYITFSLYDLYAKYPSKNSRHIIHSFTWYWSLFLGDAHPHNCLAIYAHVIKKYSQLKFVKNNFL